MEAAAFNAAHINVALIHERFDEKRKSFTAGPKRWVTSNMRPESFHKLKAASNIGNNLRKYGSSSTSKHAQGHVWVWSRNFHELF